MSLAEQDLVAAQVLLTNASVANRIACFLGQQAAEKALKAGLIAVAVEYPKIHGLTELLSRFPADRGPDVDSDELDTLDPWVIDGQYAADLPDVDDAEATSLAQIADRPCRHFGARPRTQLGQDARRHVDRSGAGT